jgi:hypothetical protein
MTNRRRGDEGEVRVYMDEVLEKVARIRICGWFRYSWLRRPRVSLWRDLNEDCRWTPGENGKPILGLIAGGNDGEAVFCGRATRTGVLEFAFLKGLGTLGERRGVLTITEARLTRELLLWSMKAKPFVVSQIRHSRSNELANQDQ